jgi:hypothetical protein
MATFKLPCMLVIFLVFGAGLGQNVDPFGPGVGRRREMVPAMFIFGDSLIDNGNNNNLPSFAKANYFPYGIDFNGGPTGRFSNGYTMVDEIGKSPLPSSMIVFAYMLSLRVVLESRMP